MSKQQWENGATGKCARTAYINVSKNERIYCKYYKRRRQEASWDVQGGMEPSPSCIRRSINKAALVAVEALSMNRAEQSRAERQSPISSISTRLSIFNSFSRGSTLRGRKVDCWQSIREHTTTLGLSLHLHLHTQHYWHQFKGVIFIYSDRVWCHCYIIITETDTGKQRKSKMLTGTQLAKHSSIYTSTESGGMLLDQREDEVQNRNWIIIYLASDWRIR